ncbi:WXG100 family type VII secretion target [Catellatospora tritici]|uniref:WXG100 family type VII secretion target n=1 Tax=Catellatospora tritici TaxID=2851566 RepID=UPI001C2D32ED|nr:WXG100 family type VII secretion target [Catellatospora tritici]MBV1851949.1 WXG100 family type VII secretion target [Catellatospora tritici]
MSDRLVVDFQALHSASEHIQKAINSLDSHLDQLESDAKPLISTWSGSAQAAYHERQHKWRNAANDLSAMLRDIKGAVDEAAVQFKDAEDRNTRLFLNH